MAYTKYQLLDCRIFVCFHFPLAMCYRAVVEWEDGWLGKVNIDYNQWLLFIWHDMSLSGFVTFLISIQIFSQHGKNIQKNTCLVNFVWWTWVTWCLYWQRWDIRWWGYPSVTLIAFCGKSCQVTGLVRCMVCWYTPSPGQRPQNVTIRCHINRE